MLIIHRLYHRHYRCHHRQRHRQRTTYHQYNHHLLSFRVFEDFDTNGDGHIDIVDFVDLNSLNPSAPLSGFAWWKAFKVPQYLSHYTDVLQTA